MYLITTTTNTHGLLKFDHDHSPGSDLFREGTVLATISFDLCYEVKKKKDIDKIKRLHLIHTTGPELISDAFRSVIESAAPGVAEFFNVRILCDGKLVPGFSAINLPIKLACIDLQQSEYRQTNFDPSAPTFSFSYMKLMDISGGESEIARCAEQPAYIVAGEGIKDGCQKQAIRGLMFCRAIDLTYADRSVCEKS